MQLKLNTLPYANSNYVINECGEQCTVKMNDDKCPKWNRLQGSMGRHVCRERSDVKLKRVEKNQRYRQTQPVRIVSDREPCPSSVL